MAKNLVFFDWQNLGHVGFMVAKDMSYFKTDVVAVLNYYNDKCSASTRKSNFKLGNLKCKDKS